jgi:hypothetical protein
MRLAVLVLALAVVPAGADAACLTYTDRVRLEGVLERKTFPGPPNYSSVAKGDSPEVAWLLRLDAPACVDADPGDTDGFSVKIEKLRRVQLAPSTAEFKRQAKRLGTRVTVSGKLFGAHTGHHHTAALLGEVRFEK